MEQPFDLAAELAKQPHLLEIAGNLLMKSGPEDYIGAVLCLRGTLYFKRPIPHWYVSHYANASMSSSA